MGEISKIILYLIAGVAIIPLLLILFVSIRASIKKIKQEGWKSIDEWNEIQALTNIAVIISFLFLPLTFFLSIQSQEISVKQSDENLTIQYKGLEIDLTKYEYLKWENQFISDGDKKIKYVAYKGENDDDLKCFKINIYPTFKNVKSGFVSDPNSKYQIRFSYDCTNDNIKVNYGTDKIEIIVENIENEIYAFSPSNEVQRSWLNQDRYEFYGYYTEIEYYPSLNRHNKCTVSGINNVKKQSTALSESMWN